MPLAFFAINEQIIALEEATSCPRRDKFLPLPGQNIAP